MKVIPKNEHRLLSYTLNSTLAIHSIPLSSHFSHPFPDIYHLNTILKHPPSISLHINIFLTN
eukprot:UN02460